MTEIGYRKTKITSSDWINWLEPLRYVKEKQIKEIQGNPTETWKLYSCTMENE